MKDVIQALVVEDDPIVQLGLSSLIGSISYICCERCITRQAFSEYPTDDFGQTIVILKSLSTAVQDLNYFRKVHRQFSHARCLLFCDNRDVQYIYSVFQVGILACLPSHSPRWEIEGAIKQICERKPYLSSFFGTRLVNGLCGDGSVPVLRNCSHSSALLSAREQDLLYYLSQGFSNKEIAQELHLTEATVRNYISHLYSKLEISHRSEAVAYACTYIAMNTSDTSWSEKKKYIASNTSESQNN